MNFYLKVFSVLIIAMIVGHCIANDIVFSYIGFELIKYPYRQDQIQQSFELKNTEKEAYDIKGYTVEVDGVPVYRIDEECILKPNEVKRFYFGDARSSVSHPVEKYKKKPILPYTSSDGFYTEEMMNAIRKRIIEENYPVGEEREKLLKNKIKIEDYSRFFHEIVLLDSNGKILDKVLIKYYPYNDIEHYTGTMIEYSSVTLYNYIYIVEKKYYFSRVNSLPDFVMIRWLGFEKERAKYLSGQPYRFSIAYEKGDLTHASWTAGRILRLELYLSETDKEPFWAKTWEMSGDSTLNEKDVAILTKVFAEERKKVSTNPMLPKFQKERWVRTKEEEEAALKEIEKETVPIFAEGGIPVYFKLYFRHPLIEQFDRKEPYTGITTLRIW